MKLVTKRNIKEIKEGTILLIKSLGAKAIWIDYIEKVYPIKTVNDSLNGYKEEIKIDSFTILIKRQHEEHDKLDGKQHDENMIPLNEITGKLEIGYPMHYLKDDREDWEEYILNEKEKGRYEKLLLAARIKFEMKPIK